MNEPKQQLSHIILTNIIYYGLVSEYFMYVHTTHGFSYFDLCKQNIVNLRIQYIIYIYYK